MACERVKPNYFYLRSAREGQGLHSCRSIVRAADLEVIGDDFRKVVALLTLNSEALRSVSSCQSIWQSSPEDLQCSSHVTLFVFFLLILVAVLPASLTLLGLPDFEG